MPVPARLTPVKKQIETLMAELSETLANEFDALRNRDIERLETTIRRKSAIVSRLESVAREVEHLGIEHGGADLGAAWPDLRDTTAECVLANRTNGGAIELNRGLVAGLLDTLYGVSRAERTYDAHGHFDQQDAARSVGRA